MEKKRKRVEDVDGPTPQQRLDAPETFNLDMDAKVHVFRSGQHPTLLDDLVNNNPDPFEDLYETAVLDPDTGEVRPESLEKIGEAHRISDYIESRLNQRAALLAKQERDEGGPVPVKKQEELLISHALEVEDDRAGIVETVSRNLIIEPPFHPAVLEGLTTTNNTLNPLVGAMEVNVAGTGWELLPVDTFEMEEAVEGELSGLEPDERDAADAAALAARQAKEKEFDDEVAQQREGLEDFFNEPWPGVSWTTMERKLCRDREKTGNSYMEVLRNAKDEIVLARRIDPKLMRLVRLDDPVVVEKEMKRGGQTVKLNVPLRERRFVEQVGGGAIIPRFRQSPSTAGQDPDATVSALGPSTQGQSAFFAGQGIRIIYFKEFGASRDLDMWTGAWAKEDEQIPFERRATEIIHRTVNESHRTPYGLPRWINEMPAVLGSRKAEEFNLSFFDAGGVPPMLITIAGGQMATKAHDALKDMMNTQNPASKHQAVVLEITGSGRMDKTNAVKIGVERFGSERTQDAMFQKYDERTQNLVRMSFRLPPIFMGDAETHNFNTVKSSYLVAEAQVFQPERDESDEVVTMKLLRSMPNGENFRFHSLPLVVDDTSEQIECIKIADDGDHVASEQIIQALNKVCGLDFTFDQAQQDKKEREEKERMDSLRQMAGRGAPFGGDQEEGEDGKPPQKPAVPAEKPEEGEEVAKVVLKKLDGYVALGIDLADALAAGVHTPRTRMELKKNLALFEELAPSERELVERVMSMKVIGSDDDEVREVFGCTAHIFSELAKEPEPEQV